MLSPEEIGRANERRFFAIFSDPSLVTPWWFMEMRTVSRTLDAHGVDAVATIHDPQKINPIRVPFQIKSSCAAMTDYFVKHPRAWFAGVVVVVVNKYRSDHVICGRVFRALQEIHEKEIRYDSYFKTLKTI